MPEPDFSLERHSIIVAGAASGLGRAMAVALSRLGARLTLVDRDELALAPVVRECGADAQRLVADITQEDGVRSGVALALGSFGQLDGAVNCAGLLRIAPALELPVEEFRASLEVNVTGAFLFSRACAEAMSDKGGSIVHLASVSSSVANRNYAAYAASKAALSHMTRVLAREWAGKRIRVNAIGPAMTLTGMTAGHLSEPRFHDEALAAIPMGRFGSPEDLIGSLVLLLSPAGAFITGQTVYVDGGRTLV